MTATINEQDVDLDAEWLSLLDSFTEEAEPCHFNDMCGNAADYKCHTRCCGMILFFCEDCLLKSKNYLIDASKSFGRKTHLLICNNCGTRNKINADWLIVDERL